jgi:hypothetical protein
MKNTTASTLLPKTTPDVDDLRIAIDRLESEAPTHDNRRADAAEQRPVVPSGIPTKRPL